MDTLSQPQPTCRTRRNQSQLSDELLPFTPQPEAVRQTIASFFRRPITNNAHTLNKTPFQSVKPLALYKPKC